MWVYPCVVAAWCAAAAAAVRYDFYRAAGPAAPGGAGGGGARRIFGGAPVVARERLAAVAAAALLDRYWSTRCSGALLAPRWVLTAAHCIEPHVAYVRCALTGRTSPAVLLYRHPEFAVVIEDTDMGRDVTALRHDIGLVGAREDLDSPTPPPPALRALSAPTDLVALATTDAEVEVFGFGSTGEPAGGGQMYSARLQLAACARAAWRPCACGVAPVEPRGVCAGDSGGPVFYKGVLVGVTSMGPTECGAGAGGGTAPPSGATSVFTALAPYAALLNATMRGSHAARQRLMYELQTDGGAGAAPLDSAAAAAQRAAQRVARVAGLFACFVLR